MELKDRFMLRTSQTASFESEFKTLCQEANIYAPNPFIFNHDGDSAYIDINKSVIEKLDETKVNELPFLRRYSLV